MPQPKQREVPREARIATRSTAQLREDRRSTSTSPERRGARRTQQEPDDPSPRRSGSVPPTSGPGGGAESPTPLNQRREEFAEYALMTVNTRVAAIKMSIGRFENLCRNIETEEKRIPLEYEKIRKDIVTIGTHAANQGVAEVCGESIDYLGLELETICNRIDSHLIELHGVSTFANRIPIPRLFAAPSIQDQPEDPVPHQQHSPKYRTPASRAIARHPRFPLSHPCPPSPKSATTSANSIATWSDRCT